VAGSARSLMNGRGLGQPESVVHCWPGEGWSLRGAHCWWHGEADTTWHRYTFLSFTSPVMLSLTATMSALGNRRRLWAETLAAAEGWCSLEAPGRRRAIISGNRSLSSTRASVPR